jgi:hypothetical protein
MKRLTLSDGIKRSANTTDRRRIRNALHLFLIMKHYNKETIFRSHRWQRIFFGDQHEPLYGQLQAMTKWLRRKGLIEKISSTDEH